jgi:hypothetical protein
VTADELQSGFEAAGQVVDWYQRASWGRHDVRDLQNEAVVAVLEASRTYDPGVGVSFPFYARYAVGYRLKRWIWDTTLPVRAKTPGPRGSLQKKLTELGGVPLDEAHHPIDHRTPEALLHEMDWLHKVRERLEKVLSPRARELVLEEKSYVEAALERGSSVRAGHDVTTHARRKLRQDRRLQSLWNER